MLAGYCWPQSLLSGESTRVFCHSGGVNSSSHVQMQVVRKGAQDKVVLEQKLPVFEQPLHDDLSINGCQWQPSVEIKVDAAWPTGFYLVRFVGPDSSSIKGAAQDIAEAFFVVRSSERLDALLVLSTSTWAAYNDWGGPSYYTGGNKVALQRPLPKGFLDKSDPHLHRIARYMDWTKDQARGFARAGYSQWCMAAGWANWEMLFVRWAEAQGLRLGYATSLDLHQNPDLLAGYPAYVSVGHDEYWTGAMRDHVETYIDNGGNAAFFSGNTSFWQARFERNDTQLVCYKTAIEKDPLYHSERAPQLSTMWSDPLVDRPESAMTGVSFIYGGYAHMPNSPRGTGGYKILQPDHWAFESVACEVGDSLGAESIVVGYECDGCEFTVEQGKPVAKGVVGGTPTDFQVLASAPAKLWETHEAPGELDESFIGEINWIAERLGGADTPANRQHFTGGHAVMGAFERGRGQVFTTGCTDWAYGLDEPGVATVTRNVLKRFMHRSR